MLRSVSSFAFDQGHWSQLDQSAASLRSRLAPFFTIDHAVRGQLQGPYHELTVPHRNLVLDVAFLLLANGPDDVLLAAINRAVRGQEEQEYWIQLITARNKL